MRLMAHDRDDPAELLHAQDGGAGIVLGFEPFHLDQRRDEFEAFDQQFRSLSGTE